MSIDPHISPDPHLATGTPFSDPCFREPLPHSFRYAAAEADAALATVLAQRVARCRTHLLSHVQRIHLHAEHGSAEQLAGALADLFITLGDKGRDLKLRMLDITSPHLDDTWLSFLYDHLDSGLEAATPLPATQHSRLTAAMTDHFDLVARTTNTAATLTLLDEVHELLNNGAIDAARHLLETALLEDPTVPELHWELLEIYRHTRDYDHMQRMAAQLAPLEPRVRDAWQQTREALLNKVGEQAAL